MAASRAGLALAAAAAVAASTGAAAEPPTLALNSTEANQRPAVVFVLNSAYFHVFDNFVRAPAIASLAHWDVHLLCTDAQVGAMVAAIGWRCRETRFASKQAAKTYTKRIPYVVELVRSGRDVLISDVDAIWLRDPLPELREVAAGAGIIGSRGASPPRVRMKHGASFCMGFIFFKGSDPRVGAALEALTVPMREDQTDFNLNMMREGIRWDEGFVKYIGSNATSYGTLRRRGMPYTGLRVALLPHSRFARVCQNRDVLQTATIAHCHNRGKKQYLKVQKLASLGLWYAGKDAGPPPPEPQQSAEPAVSATKSGVALHSRPSHRKAKGWRAQAPQMGATTVLRSTSWATADRRCSVQRRPGVEDPPWGMLHLAHRDGVLCAIGRGRGESPALTALLLQLACDYLSHERVQLPDFERITLALEGAPCTGAHLRFASACPDGGCAPGLVPHFSFVRARGLGVASFTLAAADAATAGANAAASQACVWADEGAASTLSALRVKRLATEEPNAIAATGGKCQPSSRSTGGCLANSTGGPQVDASVWACALHVGGKGASARLPILLHSGRPAVVANESVCEWYTNPAMHSALRPYAHYLPVAPGLTDLAERARTPSRGDTSTTAAMGRRAQAFARRFLNLRTVVHFWGMQLLEAAGAPTPPLEERLTIAAGGHRDPREEQALARVAHADPDSMAVWWPRIFGAGSSANKSE